VALGTPVYTTFEGRLGAVDEKLLDGGRMRRLSSPDEIALEKRTGTGGERIRRDPRLLVDRLLAT
jgi:predicted glycosyltransferase